MYIIPASYHYNTAALLIFHITHYCSSVSLYTHATGFAKMRNLAEISSSGTWHSIYDQPMLLHETSTAPRQDIVLCPDPLEAEEGVLFSTIKFSSTTDPMIKYYDWSPRNMIGDQRLQSRNAVHDKKDH